MTHASWRGPGRRPAPSPRPPRDLTAPLLRRLAFELGCCALGAAALACLWWLIDHLGTAP